ncbi:hypothetical protein R6Z07F_015905 [Ovis aries]
MRVSGRARRCRRGRPRWVLQSPGTSHPEERPPHPGPRCSRRRHCPSAPWVGVFRTVCVLADLLLFLGPAGSTPRFGIPGHQTIRLPQHLVQVTKLPDARQMDAETPRGVLRRPPAGGPPWGFGGEQGQLAHLAKHVKEQQLLPRPCLSQAGPARILRSDDPAPHPAASPRNPIKLCETTFPNAVWTHWKHLTSKHFILSFCTMADSPKRGHTYPLGNLQGNQGRAQGGQGWHAHGTLGDWCVSRFSRL